MQDVTDIIGKWHRCTLNLSKCQCFMASSICHDIKGVEIIVGLICRFRLHTYRECLNVFDIVQSLSYKEHVKVSSKTVMKFIIPFYNHINYSHNIYKILMTLESFVLFIFIQLIINIHRSL